MNPEEYESLAAVEATHWYYRGKREIVRRWLARHANLGQSSWLLDVGTGTGLFAEEMSRTCCVVGLDDHDEALTIARTRPGPVWIKGSSPLPFRDNAFDALTALDVLEHIADDQAALAELARVLKPGGRMLLTVPAFMLLWSRWDESLHHFRRYRRGRVVELARAAGLQVIACRYINSLPFVPILVYRWLRERTPFFRDSQAENKIPPPWLNEVLFSTFVATASPGAPAWPFGVSVLSLLRKPQT